ncbi:uncharacterized protein TA10285 [Theileria annulata]|uniref:Uncharacterized protein n=1 Tax=Theileria annulata TaxID=5874 RepID=Q4U8W3_THEAN|nr:uncharacterized protein TA10285 [Theileria annulata]CAI76740.1 hypothetical protein, conserved [Theileria annulata]|eukprot:XP_953365.1 hypothetical protein, conserved [Theileria annulata]
MFIFLLLVIFLIPRGFSYLFRTNTKTPYTHFKTQSFGDSSFRTPLPGGELNLPGVNEPSGEILLDRPLIEKVASLRTFIECIEINRGKTPESTGDEQSEGKVSSVQTPQNENKFVEINEENLEPIKDLLAEEDLLEEVLSNAFVTYRDSKDSESIKRLQTIAEQIVPIASKLRKEKSERNITRLVSCYMNEKEDLDKVLKELQEKRALDKYLLKRLDELINLAAKKYRISDDHPAISEEFLKVLKERIAAERVTYIRGTDLFVKTLARCFAMKNEEEWNEVIKENIKTMDDLEEFYEWIQDGIEFCKRTKMYVEKNSRMMDKVEVMEKIIPSIVRQHPVWTPRDEHIEYEENPIDEEKYKEYKQYLEEDYFEKKGLNP